MKKITSLLLIIYTIFFNITPAYAGNIKTFSDNVETINNNISAQVYAFKKTKHYTAVEIGFINSTNQYVEFTPQEIYLDDEVKYSLPLLSIDQVQSIEQKKPGNSLIPLALGVGLGIASIATSRGSSHSDLSFGLGMGALAAGGAALLTSGFDNQSKKNKLITFENNSLASIDKLPPGMTLGGVLYFPPTKKPKSITIISRTKSGKFENKVFDLSLAKGKKLKKR